MKRRLSAVVLILFPAAAVAQESGIVMQQTAMGMPQTAVIASAGVRTTLAGLTWILRTSDAKVIEVSDEQREYSEMLLAEWQQRMTARQQATDTLQEDLEAMKKEVCPMLERFGVGELLKDAEPRRQTPETPWSSVRPPRWPAWRVSDTPRR